MSQNALLSQFLVNMAAPISVVLPCEPHKCKHGESYNRKVRGWPPGSTVCLTPILLPQNTECQAGEKHVPFFQVFSMNQLGIEPRFPRLKAIFHHGAIDAVYHENYRKGSNERSYHKTESLGALSFRSLLRSKSSMSCEGYPQ